ncbi:MAG: rRNA (guanine527-N7)-methyltransferase [Solirubrobacteraceae bacterium]|nr:rRNA (guanine527-N7)-methyltransferase [Solirubrobacteraceae bacterium]
MSCDPQPDASGVARFGLSADQQAQLSALLELLRSDEHAPSAIRDPAQAIGAHVADSLAALDIDAVRGASRLADLGSGAGFPGIALAVALPASEVILIESNRRRCEFLARMCAAAALGNARVVCARVEEWSEGLSRSDVVLARALAPQAVVLEYAAPLLRMGGRLVDWRGRRRPEEESAAAKAAEALGLRRVEVRRVGPFQGADEHHLHVFAKDDETPERFPRRAGMARKRPLGD